MTQINSVIKRSEDESAKLFEYARTKAEGLFSRVDSFVGEFKLQLEEAGTIIQEFERAERERQEKERREAEQWFKRQGETTQQKPKKWFKGKKVRESAIVKKQQQIDDLRNSIAGDMEEMSEETAQLLRELRGELEVMQATNETNVKNLRSARNSLIEVQSRVDEALLEVNKEKYQHQETAAMLERKDSEVLKQQEEIERYLSLSLLDTLLVTLFVT